MLAVEEKTRIIDQILWGKAFAVVLNGIGEELTFILRSLSIRETNLCRFIQAQETKEALELGVMSRQELKDTFEAQGVWTPAHEEQLVQLDKQVKYLQSQIKDNEFFVQKKKAFTKSLEKVRAKIEKMRQTKTQLFSVSAEDRAEEIMRRYMLHMSAEDIQEQPYWENQTVFMQEQDTMLLYHLAIAYYENNVFPEKTVRCIARSPEWRYRWTMATKGVDLFGRPISEWSDMQNSLVYWSQYYDGIFNSMERPADHIIENDEACDAWVRDKNKSNGSSAGAKLGSKNTNIFGNKKATTHKEHNEQFIMVGGDRETVERVQDMNPKSTRRQLAEEYKYLKQHGKTTEWKLRQDSRRKRYD